MPRLLYYPLLSLSFGIATLLPMSGYADCMGPYPPSMVTAFNQNCATDPKMTSFCSCIMDEVQKTIPLADFIEIGNSQGGISNDARFIKASQKCTSLIPSTPTAATPAATAPSQVIRVPNNPQSLPSSIPPGATVITPR